jgi:uncharacterized membrane protein YbaN (DUF454 family)
MKKISIFTLPSTALTALSLLFAIIISCTGRTAEAAKSVSGRVNGRILYVNMMNAARLAMLISGFICLGVGTIGIFVPVLPATPLYIVAAFCFSKSSVRFHNWFTQTILYKKHLASLMNNRKMTLKAKLGILIPVSAMIVLAILTVKITALQFILIALLLVKYWFFIFKIKTIKPCNKRYNTAGQALHPPPAAAFRGKPRGIIPFGSSLAQSCPCKHGRDFAPFVNNNYKKIGTSESLYQ